jgi:hypothetical protein
VTAATSSLGIADGATKIYANVKDKVGNYTTLALPFTSDATVDSTAPTIAAASTPFTPNPATGAIYLASGVYYVNTTSVTASLNNSDTGGSGLEFSVVDAVTAGSGAPTTPTSITADALTTSTLTAGDSYDVYASAVDNVGNISAYSKIGTVYYDDAGPTFGTSTPTVSSNTVSGITLSDAGSGVDSTTASLSIEDDDGNTGVAAGSITYSGTNLSFTYSGTISASSYVKFKIDAQDHLSNANTYYIKVESDGTVTGSAVSTFSMLLKGFGRAFTNVAQTTNTTVASVATKLGSAVQSFMTTANRPMQVQASAIPATAAREVFTFFQSFTVIFMPPV